MIVKFKTLFIVLCFLIFTSISSYAYSSLSDLQEYGKRHLRKYDKISYLLVVDTSLSMKKNFNNVQNSINDFIDTLNDGDMISVITFDSNVALYIPPTVINDNYKKFTIENQISQLYAKGEYTYLASALRESRRLMQRLEKRFPNARSVILLFSDNRDDPPPGVRTKDRVNLKQEALKFKQMRGWMVVTISLVKQTYNHGADVASMMGGTFIPYKNKSLLNFYLKFIHIFMKLLPFIEILLTLIILTWIFSIKPLKNSLLNFLVILGFMLALLLLPQKTLKYIHYFYAFIWQFISSIINYIIKIFIFNKIRFFALLIGIIILFYYRKKLKVLKEHIKKAIKFSKLKNKEEIIAFLQEEKKDKKLIKYLGKIKDERALIKLYGDNDEFKKMVQKQLDKIKNNQQYIFLTGSFSSGKSFFLKALTNLKIFESKSVPTTHVLHYLSYGRNKFLLYYKSGKVRKINSHNLDYDFIEKNQYLLEKIKIFNKNISKKLLFIDSPGTAALDENFKIDKQFMILVDIILYFIDALKPLADYDKKNIRKLLKFNKRIIFVVTKIDMLDENENNISDIGNFLYTNLKTKLKIKNAEIVFISSKYYLKGKETKDQFLLFESNLSSFLKYLKP